MKHAMACFSWKRFFRITVGVAIAVFISACGGGGDGADSGQASNNAAPNASFVATPPGGKAALLVQFDAAGSSDSDSTIVSYEWDFGDGASGGGVSASHQYTTQGTYTATLTVTDDGGVSSSITTDIVVAASNVLPVPSFTATPSSGKASLTVQLDASASSDSDGQVASYGWDYGNGVTGEGVSSSQVYSAAGVYIVTLTVTDDDGAAAVTSTAVIVSPANIPPSASFSATPSTGKASLTVQLDAASSSDSDGTISTYGWDFGDGQTGSGVSTSHIYTTQGTYVVTLTVTDDDGVSVDSVASIVVTAPNVAPTASFTATPSSGKAALTVQLNAAGSTDSDGTISAYSWDFGDGQSGVGLNPGHVYATAGTYIAILTVTDDDGATASISSAVVVSAANVLPGASFTASPLTGAAPLIVSVDATASTDSDGTISSYSWDFGDGQTGSGVSSSHGFVAQGTYLITLTVTDNDGGVDTSTATVVVATGNVAPVASFTATPTSGSLPLVVQVDASASSDADGTISSYSWNFGNGQTGSGVTASHGYTVQGSYVITLTVVDNSGAIDTSTTTIVVAAANVSPVASFTATPTSGDAPLVVQFDGTGSSDSDGSISIYSWDFDDGQFASGSTVSHTYTAQGTYAAVLTVTDNGGASASTNASIVVAATPVPTTTLSGSISIASATIVDSDVNDASAAYVANDTDGSAQALPNPVMLGGYLNVAGTGNSGASFVAGDTSDYYSISLVAGQVITVTIGDPVEGDLDLHLYHDDGSVDPANPDYLSAGTGQVESLTVATSGDYLIEVTVDSGFANYTLVVGQAAPLFNVGGLSSTDEFMAGDVIVKFRDNSIGASVLQTPNAQAASLGLQLKSSLSSREPMLMGLGAAQGRQAAFDRLGIAFDVVGKTSGKRRFKSNDPAKQLKLETMQVIKALRKRADVLYAEPNYLHKAHAVPTDTYYGFQWHYPLINLPTAWDIATGDAAVTVAVVDTGVLLNHPDLIGQFSADGGYDFISDDSNSDDGQSGIDANPDDPGDGSGVGSSSFHGTHVAGTIGAATSFSPGGAGVAGVAPGVKIMPVRVLGKLGGTSYDILQGVSYAAGLANDSGITLNASQRADVINLSLGRLGSYSQMEQDVYTAVRNAGVIVVAAAGNNNSSAANYPASYAEVISVSAVDHNKSKAPYSSFGTTVDVAAPGGDTSVDLNGDGYVDGVLSTLADDSGASLNYTYAYYQGTSMAAPHVAGVIGLMKSVYSGLTPANVDALLLSGAIVDDLGTAGRDDTFGHGLINAHSAVVQAQVLASVTPVDNPVLGVAASSLNLGAVDVTALLAASNVGSGVLTVSSVSDNAAWLSVVAESVDGSQLGTYRVTIDRASLLPGTYQAEISFVSSVNTVTVPVLMQVVTQALNANAGYHYVLLLDASDFSLVDSWAGEAQSGSYHYQFTDAPFPVGREYYVIAGTDHNNDGFICEPGEACGAYLSLNDMRIIDTSSTPSGNDFMTGFGLDFQATSLSEKMGYSQGIRR